MAGVAGANGSGRFVLWSSTVRPTMPTTRAQATSPEHFPAVVSTTTGINPQAIAFRTIGRRGRDRGFMDSPFDGPAERHRSLSWVAWELAGRGTAEPAAIQQELRRRRRD